MELFRLLGTIAINNTEANDALKQTSEEGEKAHSKLSGAFEKIGGAAVKAGQVIGAGVAAGAAAIGALAAKALDGYADYEQLVGGVETLFGAGGKTLEEYAASVGKTVSEVRGEYDSLMKAQQTVLDNASQAYKTAGLSANEYMETVTSFSASLIQSLNGNTEEAAAKANQAIVDMSDNANKMGTDMALIQNAYNGFAKGNYTMLDNLKLGYGGTQEEMKRLLADAEKLSGMKYDISNFGDVVDAIHEIQKEVGIADATLNEAATTISGSISAMKASWSNLIAGLGNEDADLSGLVNQFVDSVGTVADNVIPRVEIILNGIGELIVTMIPKIADKLPGIVSSLLPALVNGAVALVDGLVKSMPAIVSVLMGVMPELLNGILRITTAIIDALPQIIDAICAALPDLIPALIVGLVVLTVELAAALPEIVLPIIEAIPQIAQGIMEGFTDCLKRFGLEGAANAFGEIGEKISEVYTTYIQPVIDGFVGLIGELFTENQDKIGKIGEWWTAICGTIQIEFQRVYNLIVPLIEFFSNFITEHMDTIKAVIQAGIDYLTAIIDFFVAFVTRDWEGMWTAICSLAESWIEFLINIFTLWVEYVGSILNGLYTKATQVFTNIKTKITTIVTTIRTWVQNAFTQMRDSLALIWDAIAKKIADVWNGIWETMKGIMNNIIGGIESMVNRCIDAINELIEGINALVGKVPGISEIPLLPSFKLPRLEKGGILEKGEIGLLEGNGAEAVVPLDQNQKWISAVAADMEVAMGGKGTAEKMQVLINIMSDIRDNLPEALVEAMKTIRLDVDNREFARLVKAVN